MSTRSPGFSSESPLYYFFSLLLWLSTCSKQLYFYPGIILTVCLSVFICARMHSCKHVCFSPRCIWILEKSWQSCVVPLLNVGLKLTVASLCFIETFTFLFLCFQSFLFLRYDNLPFFTSSVSCKGPSNCQLLWPGIAEVAETHVLPWGAQYSVYSCSGHLCLKTLLTNSI